MKSLVVFFLSSFTGVNTGIGGHYRSIKDIALSLAESAEVHVVTFGNLKSPVYGEVDWYRHIHMSSPFDVGGWVKLRAFCKEMAAGLAGREASYISVGEIDSHVPMWLSSIGLDVKCIHVKPGGKRAKRPGVFKGMPLVVFHKMDYEDFRGHNSEANLLCAPGRVIPPAYDAEYLANTKRPDSSGQFVNAICIMRIAEEKLESLGLIYRAISNVAGIAFYHYGVVQDSELLGKLDTVPEERYFLVSDNYAVKDAARALHGFDVFCGIGRSAMEAMSLGIPAFIPVHADDGGSLLVAITRENWTVFGDENFTQRAKLADLKKAGRVILLQEAVEDKDLLRQLSVEVRDIYTENLSPAASVARWMKFIASSRNSRGMHDFVRLAFYLRAVTKLRYYQ